jgi:serine/threonine protein phosphatase PrpC
MRVNDDELAAREWWPEAPSGQAPATPGAEPEISTRRSTGEWGLEGGSSISTGRAVPSPRPTSELPRNRYRVRGASDVGRKRETNEDAFLVDEDLSLFVVADGMGGHQGGDTASRLAVDTLQRAVRKSQTERPQLFSKRSTLEESPLPVILREAMEDACLAIFSKAQGAPSLHGMGTTVTALLLHGPHAFLAHVGDSRLYLVRGGRIQQISDDHSLVNEQVKAGVITPDEARKSHFKNVITRSVGYEAEVVVDLLGVEAKQGDLFLLCCDGLTNLVDDREIATLATTEAVEDLPVRLIGLANDRGGDDNVTVIALELEAVDTARAEPEV